MKRGLRVAQTLLVVAVDDPYCGWKKSWSIFSQPALNRAKEYPVSFLSMMISVLALTKSCPHKCDLLSICWFSIRRSSECSCLFVQALQHRVEPLMNTAACRSHPWRGSETRSDLTCLIRELSPLGVSLDDTSGTLWQGGRCRRVF